MIGVLLIAWVVLDREVSHRFARTTILVMGILLVLTPWTIRNHRYYGEFIPLTTNAGINLYIGNNPEATNRYHLPDESARPPYRHHESRKYLTHTLRYMAENKLLTLQRYAQKLVLYWTPQDRWQIFLYGAMVLGWVRLLLARSVPRGVRVWLIGAPLAMGAFHALFFILWRFVLIVWPMICLAAAIGVLGVGRGMREDPAGS